ncbi:MAG: hypothetical protein SGILL_004338, partial [Bacillariaceae sp.]
MKLLLALTCATALLFPHDVTVVLVDGFSTSVLPARGFSTATTTATATALDMATAASADNFFDDFYPEDSSSSSHHPRNSRNVQQQEDSATNTKFVSGDELHRLRHQVLALRLELQEARRNLQIFGSDEDEINTDNMEQDDDDDDHIEYRHTRHYHEQRVQELERAIMKTQQ